MEFEVESFDAAIATITKLILGIKGAFVSAVNSDKLLNGKVKGSITVRVPTGNSSTGWVFDLRATSPRAAELKGVKLTSQDVTKAYTDIESRLRGARTMEQRLLQVIKEGKGEIKQLLEAEKELGVWRTKIEEFEGELRYYANLAALSTLTISLTEKEIRAAAAITERERVQAGVEVEDVDKAYQQLLAAVVEAKGRITKSEMKQLTAGQFNATFNFEVAADASGPIRDRLRMLGRVARLEIDRTAQIEGSTLPSDAKPKRGDTVFLVQLYNLANVAPRETAALQVAVTDVSNAYQTLRDAVAKVAGRVLVAQLNEQDRQNITAQFEFDVRRAEEGAVRAALDAAGDVISRQVGRACRERQCDRLEGAVQGNALVREPTQASGGRDARCRGRERGRVGDPIRGTGDRGKGPAGGCEIRTRRQRRDDGAPRVRGAAVVGAGVGRAVQGGGHGACVAIGSRPAGARGQVCDGSNPCDVDERRGHRTGQQRSVAEGPSGAVDQRLGAAHVGDVGSIRAVRGAALGGARSGRLPNRSPHRTSVTDRAHPTCGTAVTIGPRRTPAAIGVKLSAKTQVRIRWRIGHVGGECNPCAENDGTLVFPGVPRGLVSVGTTRRRQNFYRWRPRLRSQLAAADDDVTSINSITYEDVFIEYWNWSLTDSSTATDFGLREKPHCHRNVSFYGCSSLRS